ncbi:LytTR family DNA-binding domain-containing protein [Algoriphagus sp. AGSA1]|uniref:LytR/AlgR family response regulator transcription factor n=1 Tax=Algoriphagus sp. AGSA1 TaxID=2907213 RepID=UPI001F27AC9C|nr:LytTR family DNA-binding domain-containing protein [Algoriphagus sp. AGSA1]MCE7056948.1 LytTR family DNA-binding domain-containing protein [Algoriphagus sp. AGSA1]
MIKAVIIEDEQQAYERLRLLVERNHSDQVKLIAYGSSSEEALGILRSEKVDLVFLDVELGGSNAFEMLRQLDEIPFKIIFTTAHERFALQAIKFSALDYLMKPIDPGELSVAVNLFVAKGKDLIISEKLDNIFSYYAEGATRKKIGLPTLAGIEFVMIADIIRCQADVNYTYFFLRDGRKILVSKTLKEFEALLSGFQFFRIHNSHLINLQEVKSYQRGKGGVVQLIDGSELEVAQRRKEGLMEALRKI